MARGGSCRRTCRDVRGGGHLEAGGGERAAEALFEAVEVVARRRAQERGLDAERQAAVPGAGFPEALGRGDRVAETAATGGVPLAVAAACCPLRLEGLAQRIPFTADRVGFFAAGGVVDQELDDGLAAGAVVGLFVEVAAHDQVEDLHHAGREVQREASHLR